MSNFSGISVTKIFIPSKIPAESDILSKAIYETARPPKINKTT